LFTRGLLFTRVCGLCCPCPVPLTHTRPRSPQTTYESGKASVCATGPQTLGGLGEGISLYFYILRYLLIYFLLATLLVVPHMLLSFNGDALVAKDRDPAQLIRFTSINHADVQEIYKEDRYVAHSHRHRRTSRFRTFASRLFLAAETRRC